MRKKIYALKKERIDKERLFLGKKEAAAS